MFDMNKIMEALKKAKKNGLGFTSCDYYDYNAVSSKDGIELFVFDKGTDNLVKKEEYLYKNGRLFF